MPVTRWPSTTPYIHRISHSLIFSSLIASYLFIAEEGVEGAADAVFTVRDRLVSHPARQAIAVAGKLAIQIGQQRPQGRHAQWCNQPSLADQRVSRQHAVDADQQF